MSEAGSGERDGKAKCFSLHSSLLSLLSPAHHHSWVSTEYSPIGFTSLANLTPSYTVKLTLFVKGKSMIRMSIAELANAE